MCFHIRRVKEDRRYLVENGQVHLIDPSREQYVVTVTIIGDSVTLAKLATIPAGHNQLTWPARMYAAKRLQNGAEVPVLLRPDASLSDQLEQSQEKADEAALGAALEDVRKGLGPAGPLELIDHVSRVQGDGRW